MTDPSAKAEAIHPPPMRPAVSREEARAAVQRIRGRAPNQRSAARHQSVTQRSTSRKPTPSARRAAIGNA